MYGVKGLIKWPNWDIFPFIMEMLRSTTTNWYKPRTGEKRQFAILSSRGEEHASTFEKDLPFRISYLLCALQLHAFFLCILCISSSSLCMKTFFPSCIHTSIVVFFHTKGVHLSSRVTTSHSSLPVIRRLYAHSTALRLGLLWGTQEEVSGLSTPPCWWRQNTTRRGEIKKKCIANKKY